MAEFSSFFPRNLLAPQREQSGIEGKDLRNDALELTSLLHERPNLVYPVIRDSLDPLLAIDHEGQRPHRMTLARRAMTRRFPASPVRQR